MREYTVKNNNSVLSIWGYPTNPHYNPDTANNGGGYWQYSGGVVISHNGGLVVVELYNDSMGDFGSRWGFEVSAFGYCWRAVCGDADDASIDDLEDVEAVCASIEGVLGLDIMQTIYEIVPVISECAWRQWQVGL